MQARSADTDADAERVQVELLRQASVGRRAGLALGLSAQVIGLAHRAIREAHPGSSDEEVKLLFVERHYGRELAADLRRYLAARRA